MGDVKYWYFLLSGLSRLYRWFLTVQIKFTCCGGHANESTATLLTSVQFSSSINKGRRWVLTTRQLFLFIYKKTWKNMYAFLHTVFFFSVWLFKCAFPLPLSLFITLFSSSAWHTSPPRRHQAQSSLGQPGCRGKWGLVLTGSETTGNKMEAGHLAVWRWPCPRVAQK